LARPARLASVSGWSGPRAASRTDRAFACVEPPCQRGPGRGRSGPGASSSAPPGRLVPVNSLSSFLHGPIEQVGHLDCAPVEFRVGAAERLDQERAHRLGLLPRLLRPRQRPPRSPASPRSSWQGPGGGGVGVLQLRVGPGLHGDHGGQADHPGQQRRRRARHRRPVPPRPPPGAAGERLGARRRPARRPVHRSTSSASAFGVA